MYIEELLSLPNNSILKFFSNRSCTRLYYYYELFHTLKLENFTKATTRRRDVASKEGTVDTMIGGKLIRVAASGPDVADNSGKGEMGIGGE